MGKTSWRSSWRLIKLVFRTSQWPSMEKGFRPANHSVLERTLESFVISDFQIGKLRRDLEIFNDIGCLSSEGETKIMCSQNQLL